MIEEISKTVFSLYFGLLTAAGLYSLDGHTTLPIFGWHSDDGAQLYLSVHVGSSLYVYSTVPLHAPWQATCAKVSILSTSSISSISCTFGASLSFSKLIRSTAFVGISALEFVFGLWFKLTFLSSIKFLMSWCFIYIYFLNVSSHHQFWSCIAPPYFPCVFLCQ